MPYKSRKERRNLPRSLKPATEKASLQAVTTAAEDVNVTKSPARASVANKSNTITPEATYSYVGSEIKWIAVVTAITAVLLIIAYYIFR